MIIILEGIDGAGKTTLANKIAGATGGTILHAGKPSMPGLLEYTMDFAHEQSSVVVCDRWHLGELVYGPLYRGGMNLTPVQFRAVEEFLAERGGFLVLCEISALEAKLRLSARGERPDYGVLEVERQLFENAYEASILPKMKRPNNHTVVQIICEAAAQAAAAREV